MKLDKNLNIKEIESFILEWNIDFPVDRWWRTKHGISFNSSLHREISFIDMYIEFYEDSLYNKSIEQSQKRKKDPYIPNSNDFLYLSEGHNGNELSDEDFDDIEI